MSGLECSEIKLREIENYFTLGAEYYSKKYIDTVSCVKQCEHVDSLKDIAKTITDGDHGVSEYYDKGILYLLSENIKRGYIDFENVKYISPSKHAVLKRSALHPRDVVVTKTGVYFGQSAVIPQHIQEANMIAHVGKITLKSSYNPYFVSSFFNCRYGYYQLRRRGIKATRPEIKLLEFADILIPKFSDMFDMHIEHLITHCNDINNTANNVYSEGQDILLSALSLKNYVPSPANTSVKAFSQFIDCNRLDAEYYLPKYDDIERKLNDYDPNIKTLAEVALYIFTGEYSEDYCGMDENKDLRYYIRGTDINGGKVEKDISHCVNPKGFTKFVTTGDIVTGRVGTIGNFGVIDKTLDSAVYSDNILCFHLPDTYLPEAYAVYFNSPMIQQLIVRLARGSVQQRLNQETLREVLVPFIKSDTQQEIAEKVRHSFALREQSKALLKVATRAVEIAIEQDETAGMKYLQEAQQAKDEKLRHPSWGDFYASESRQEKEAILQKIFNGALTPEETELFFPKDGEDK